MMTQQTKLLQDTSAPNIVLDDEKEGKNGGFMTSRTSQIPSTYSDTERSYSRRTNKIPLNPIKDGSERLHHHDPIEDEAILMSPASLGGVSYFPDHVARVSYIASVVKPDTNGNYLSDLQGGMNLLASRLAPLYFPGAIVRHITTQVDGYFPAVCPSKSFSNCQDVTSSIGIYLSMNSIAGDGSDINSSGSYNKFGRNKEVTTILDPSTMTEELLAFQESLKTAIANNELQEAIREEYRLKQDDGSSPAVIVVTDTINNVDSGLDTESNSDKDGSSVIPDGPITSDHNLLPGSGDVVDSITGDIGTATDIPLNNSTISTSPIVNADNSGDSRKDRFSTGAVISGILIAVLMVTVLVIGRKRKRRRDGDRRAAMIIKVQEKFRKHQSRPNRSINSCINNPDNDPENDQSEQKLLGNHTTRSVVDIGYLEEGLIGRTTRSMTSESTHTRDEIPISTVATNSTSYNLSHVDVDTTKPGSNNLSQNTLDYKAPRSTEINLEKRLIVGDMVANAFTCSEIQAPLSSKDHNRNNTEYGADACDGKYDEDDDGNDYVLGEDDDSDSSIGQHLLSAKKSTESQPETSEEVPVHSICANDNLYHKTTNDAEGSGNNYSSASEDMSSNFKKVSSLPSSQSPFCKASETYSPCSIETTETILPYSELDTAIANGDWGTVGATAEIIANNSTSSSQLQTFKRAKRQSLSPSSSSVRLSNFSEKVDELDRLIEAGDWKAVIVTAAKYDAEGDVVEEDASRSCRSMTSTQGSDANESCVSIMDNSSEGRSTCMGRSVATSTSQKERLQEIRVQVARMVRDVVPDEENNVDEMMKQFRGKEEELLETLRTMKEKNVARKARAESQKIARRNTRSRGNSEGFESANPNEITTVEQNKLSDTNIQNEILLIASPRTEGEDEFVNKEGVSTLETVGSFENATRVNPDDAAAAAATWAIQRSLDEMMVKEGKA